MKIRRIFKQDNKYAVQQFSYHSFIQTSFNNQDKTIAQRLVGVSTMNTQTRALKINGSKGDSEY